MRVWGVTLMLVLLSKYTLGKGKYREDNIAPPNVAPFKNQDVEY
jgi:hypothetical protein